MVSEGLESKETKPFCSNIRSQRQEAFTISSATPLPRKWMVPFTQPPVIKQTYLITYLSLYPPMGACEPPGSRIPKLEGSHFPSIDSLFIPVEGIEKLLSNLNVTKAYSVDTSPLPIWGWSDVRECGLVGLDPQDRHLESLFSVAWCCQPHWMGHRQWAP